MQGACNGGDPCDQIEGPLRTHDESYGLVTELSLCLSTEPMQNVSNGVVDPEVKGDLSGRLQLAMTRGYSLGVSDEIVQQIVHARHHAWQVN